MTTTKIVCGNEDSHSSTIKSTSTASTLLKLFFSSTLTKIKKFNNFTSCESSNKNQNSFLLGNIEFENSETTNKS
jgi:hypothetical protein